MVNIEANFKVYCKFYSIIDCNSQALKSKSDPHIGDEDLRLAAFGNHRTA